MSEFLLRDESPSKSHIRSTMLPISVENEEASKLGLFVAVCNKPQGEQLLPLLVLAAQGAGWTGSRTSPVASGGAGNGAASAHSLNFNLLLFLTAELFREHLFSCPSFEPRGIG